MLIRSRTILPFSGPAIEDGAVLIKGSIIEEVGRWADLNAAHSGPVQDLGEVILMPGLINAHCHLDYTNMAGMISPPRSFTSWIQSLMGLKANWSEPEFTASSKSGALQLLQSGTTTVADIEALPQIIPDVWSATPLRVISFLELINVKSATPPEEILNAATAHWRDLPETVDRVGLSPHATYTVSRDLLQCANRHAQEVPCRLTTHVAESEDEMQMFLYRQGPLYDWLKSQRDMSGCGRHSPVQHLAEAGYLSDRLLAVHVNYLGQDDARLLGQHGVHVVHCPGSHRYFGHLKFPLTSLMEEGVNLCLGTDSLASMPAPAHGRPRLNMFAGMQWFAEANPGLPPRIILNMATQHPARALGYEGRLGVLQTDALADLIVLPYKGSLAQAEEAVVHFQERIQSTMVAGQWVEAPGLTLPKAS